LALFSQLLRCGLSALAHSADLAVAGWLALSLHAHDSLKLRRRQR
jgi:hypothetical protein